MDKKPHILILSSWYPTEKKPFLGNFVEYQASLLSKNYQITFIRLLALGEKKQENKNLPFSYLDVYYKQSSNPLISYFSKKKAFLKGLTTIQTVDVIHAHVSFPDGWMFRLGKRILGKPLILTEHGSYFRQNNKWGLRMKIDIPLTIKKADELIAVSEYLAGDIQKRLQIKPEIVFNPVDIDRFSKVEKKREGITFLHISTLDKVKNVEPVLRAFKDVLIIDPSVRFVIVSDDDYSSLKYLAEELNISQSVSFYGPVSYDKMPEFYQNADCLVMNSLYESFSIVIAEAWSCGIPVISTSVGIASTMNLSVGIQTDGTQESVKNALVSFIENQTDFNADVIRKHAETYSIDNFLQKMDAIYNRFLN